MIQIIMILYRKIYFYIFVFKLFSLAQTQSWILYIHIGIIATLYNTNLFYKDIENLYSRTQYNFLIFIFNCIF